MKVENVLLWCSKKSPKNFVLIKKTCSNWKRVNRVKKKELKTDDETLTNIDSVFSKQQKKNITRLVFSHTQVFGWVQNSNFRFGHNVNSLIFSQFQSEKLDFSMAKCRSEGFFLFQNCDFLLSSDFSSSLKWIFFFIELIFFLSKQFFA